MRANLASPDVICSVLQIYCIVMRIYWIRRLEIRYSFDSGNLISSQPLALLM